MYGKVSSACLFGIDGRLIEVEVDVSSGLPQTTIVGLPDSAIRESAERVRAAIRNSGLEYPLARITINLAPADIRKEGASFDLAIAVGVLGASGQLPEALEDVALWIGELALDGSVRPVPGVLAMVHEAVRRGIRKVYLPIANTEEALLVEGAELIPLERLAQAAGTEACRIAESSGDTRSLTPHTFQGTKDRDNYADVRGQEAAKRALAIAAGGMHNVLLIGPPGSGKTMLMRRLPGIMPGLSDEEAFEVTKIYSAAGLLTDRSQLIRTRPFRAPHHTVSISGLAGGGSVPKPGEVSLAHRGVLFLDELPEFSRAVLETLRQPMEDRSITIGRAKGVLTFPAHFILAASMNPCPCGYFGSVGGGKECVCSGTRIQAYLARVSGPLLDRIDMHVEVPRLELAEDEEESSGEGDRTETRAYCSSSSEQLREAVTAAVQAQQRRYSGSTVRYNGELSGRALAEWSRPSKEAAAMLRDIYKHLRLSARAHDRILKVARTIADMAGCESIEAEHIAEAVQYRYLDRGWSFQ